MRVLAAEAKEMGTVVAEDSRVGREPEGAGRGARGGGATNGLPRSLLTLFFLRETLVWHLACCSILSKRENLLWQPGKVQA